MCVANSSKRSCTFLEFRVCFTAGLWIMNPLIVLRYASGGKLASHNGVRPHSQSVLKIIAYYTVSMNISRVKSSRRRTVFLLAVLPSCPTPVGNLAEAELRRLDLQLTSMCTELQAESRKKNISPKYNINQKSCQHEWLRRLGRFGFAMQQVFCF